MSEPIRPGAGPVDAAARRRAIDSTGSVLVQAPAGSGKTTLLAQRFLRLLAQVDMPERILALTFTRRAAQEMRERVMQALQAAGQMHCPSRMNAQTWDLGVAAMRHLDALGLDLQRHPSRLRIETIDSFNSWLAGQLPITAGAGARLNLTEKAAPLYAEAARRALAHDEPDVFGGAVERVLELDDQRWQSLMTLISGMLSSRDRWLPLLAGRLRATALDDEQLRQVRRHMDEDLELLVARTLRLAEAAIGADRLAALSALTHAAASRLELAQAPLAAWQIDGATLSPHAADLVRWRGVAGLLLTQQDAYRSRLTRNEGFPPQCADKEVMLELIEDLSRHPGVLRVLGDIRRLPEPAYDDGQWARVREVARVMVLAAAQLEQVFRETGSVDFPAVSMAALRALGTASMPTDLGLRLDYRLQHVLVDEFQDTSSAQLELVKLLTAGWQQGDGRSLFCVGDPMQSIYGFRQAEVRAFLELAEEGVGDVQLQVERLRSNFRSAAAVVGWVNAAFARILPRTDDRERGAIAFRPSESAQHETAADEGVRLRGFGDRRAEADAVADHIAEHSQRHPDWRIAILVRAKTHARDIAASLRAKGIAFRAVDIEPLKDRAAVRDLVMLICALLHWGDRVAWLAVLRAPWVGLVLGDLLKVARAADIVWVGFGVQGLLESLSPDGRERCLRLQSTLQAAFLVRNQQGLTRWVEQTWLALGGPACIGADDLGHVQAVFDRLRELESGDMPDAADLAGAFDDLFAEHRDASSVEIMTIHKAKGLEFDMVVVPALDRHVPSNQHPLLLSHQFARSGRDGLVLAARPGVGTEPDRLFDFLRGVSRDAATLEAERLLYVACTRAKWQLLLTAMVGRRDVEVDGEEGASAPPWKPRNGSLLAVLWPIAEMEFGVPACNSPRTHAHATPRGGALQRVPASWTAPRLASPRVEDTTTTAVSRRETPVFDWAGETARRVGTLVHAELQAIDLERSDADSPRDRLGHFRRWLTAHGVPDDRLSDASERVLAALTAVRGDTRGRWILRKWPRDDVREHALCGRFRGEVVSVVFDRSFVDQAGIRWVIDYKTSHHAGGRLDDFLDREVERYSPQMHRYAQLARNLGPEPVRVGLYFPLLGAWREWEP